MAARILLLRHVESEANRAGVGLGRTDSPPTELGLRQLELTVEALAGESVTRVLTSPLQRASRLADAIAAAHGIEAERVDDLLEMDVGELEGLEWSVARQRYGKFLDAWRTSESATVPMPGGESLADVQERAWPVLEALFGGAGTTVVVSHNFVVKMLLVRTLAMPIVEWRRIDVGLASICIINAGGEVPVLERLNDRAHLECLAGE